MFAEVNVQLLEPNVLYLDEKPPKIVRNTKGAKKMAKKKDKVEKRKAKKCKRRSLAIKKELQSITNEKTTRDQIGDSTVGSADPLYTSNKSIKMEVDNDDDEEEEEVVENKNEIKPFEDDFKYSDSEHDMDDFSPEAEEFCVAKVEYAEDEEHEPEEDDDDEGDDNDDGDDEEDYKDSDEEDDEDEEPLILIAKRKGRPRKRKIPRVEQCRDSCKQKCTQKFTEEQRRSVCNLFWSLSDEDKKLYIRQHTKTKQKRYTRVKRKNTKINSQHFAYYLDNNGNADEAEGKNAIRVCRKYFESTLRTTNYTIKKALVGYEPEMEAIVRPKPSECQQNSSAEKKLKEDTDDVQQFLDPETGNLVTIDPKAEKMKNTHSSAAKPKGKRKPGDPAPVHDPKPVKCEQRCIFKCHTKFTEEERKQICDLFWSLDYNRRKDFILARIETKDIEVQTTPEFRKSSRPPRAYHTRFFLRSGIQGENVRVCKHFMMNTLAISRMFITNAIDFADKTTGHYTGLDRRGLNAAANKIGPDRMKFIKDHIGSYPTWIPYKKSKTRYLHHSLSIKRMYLEYKQMCIAEEMKFVSTNIYYKSFHDDFRLSFLSNPGPSRGGGFLKSNPNVSHYTGEEAGGVWLDPKGEKLDLNVYNPAQSFMSLSRPQPIAPLATTVESAATPEEPPVVIEVTQQTMAAASASAIPFNQSTFSYAHLIDPNLSPSLICQTPSVAAAAAAVAVGQHEFNVNLYDSNVPHAHVASTSSLFRRL